MDHAALQGWLDHYSRAWESYDPADVAALFAEDATYRYHPADEGDDVLRGRDAIVQAWVAPTGSQSALDPAGTYEGRYRPYAIEGRRAVAVGTSTYWTDPTRTTVDRVYDNVFLLEFDDAGLCTSFTELYLKRAEP